MVGWIEICLLVGAAALLLCGAIPKVRSYRSLLWGGSFLLFISALFPRPGNGLSQYVFSGSAGTRRLPIEVFGIAWWILGAWLLTSVLDLVLRRTIFPHDNQPHARKLFADLASGFVYVVAFVGIMDTVFKQPVSAVLATSGVLAIVLGLALQNTLADVFAGLALNIERSFGAGDWITLSEEVEGQLIEINWRATRIKTGSNDMIVIPNSVVAKSIVKNHRRLNDAHICTVSLKVDHRVSPSKVIDVLRIAAGGSPGISAGTEVSACACGFFDAQISYEVSFCIDDFTLTPLVQSEVVSRVADALQRHGVTIGPAPASLRLLPSLEPGSSDCTPGPLATASAIPVPAALKSR